MEKKVITTTLNLINKNRPCEKGYEKLLNFLGKDYDPAKPINLLTILESNGANHCMWAFRATTENHVNIFGLIAADCAESVLHIYEAAVPGCNKPREAIEAARGFINGTVSKDDVLKAAKDARAAAIAAFPDSNAARAAYYAASAAYHAASAAADAYYVAAADAYYAAAYYAAAAVAAADDAAYYAAAKAAERQKQAEIIKKYLRY